MAKITRKTAIVFGQDAGANQIAEFGSLAEGTPAFSTDPNVIQSLGNWLGGWFDAVIGANSPAIEDMNAFCFVMAYQIAYLLEMGIGEWDAATPYYTNSIVQQSGLLYSSLVDNNLNNSVSNTSFWAPIALGDLSAGNIVVSSTTTLTNTANGQLVECDTSNGSFVLTLPAAPVTDFKCHLKDISGNFGSQPLTINPNGKTLEGLAANYVVSANWWDRVVFYDGSKYYLL